MHLSAQIPAARLLDLGDFSLRVEDSGTGAPAFLCLHGLVDRLEIWDRVAAGLRTRGRLVRIDQRGHGESGAPPGPYTREDLAADAVAVLDALDIERAVLVGHSMGGIISMTAALASPGRVAGLVLVGTASRCNERTARWYERIAAAGEEGGCAGIARAIYGATNPREVHGNAIGISHVTRTLKSLFDAPLTPELGQLDCPVLLLVGENDPMGPRASEQIADSISPARAELAVVPGVGHWVHVEAPGAFEAELDRWLETHAKEIAP